MSLRKFFQRVLPPHHEIRGHRHLQFLGDILHDPDIFHLTRRSAAGGTATGLFVAFLPGPGHMVIAALAAILMRVNLPLAVVLVWVTNPVTIPPLFYLAYQTGRFLLGRPPRAVHIELSLNWLSTTFVDIWPALVLGCLVLGTLAAAAGYAAVRLLWRLAVVRKMEERRNDRLRTRG